MVLSLTPTQWPRTMPKAQNRGTLHLIYSTYIPPAAAPKDAAQIPFYYTGQNDKMQSKSQRHFIIY